MLPAIFLSPSGARALTCVDLDGAYILSAEPEPVYLGFFGNNFASESIYNQFGTYGNPFSGLSVRNSFGRYGNPFSSYSVANSFTVTPPEIYVSGTLIAFLTTNSFVFGGVRLRDIDAACDFIGWAPILPAPNVPPIAFFTASPTSGTAPVTVSVNAVGSLDIDGFIVVYAWVTSDGQRASGPTARFSFPNSGTYVISLGIIDNEGATDRFERSILVETPAQPSCPSPRLIGVNTTTAASLTPTDCAVDSEDGVRFTDLYDINVPANGSLTLTVTSRSIDSLLALTTRDLTELLASGGGQGGSLDSSLMFEAAAGPYSVLVTSVTAGEVGPYVLSANLVPVPEPGPGVGLMSALAALALISMRTTRRQAAPIEGHTGALTRSKSP